MRKITIRFALWLLRVCGYNNFGVSTELLARARVLCTAAEKSFEPAWHEAKRHQVLARLIKEFPGKRKHELANAIQAALD